MNRHHLFAATVLVAVTSAFAQEATPDHWMQVAPVLSVEQVRAELARARADGTIRSWSAGYIEKLAATKSRSDVRDEAIAARASGELAAIDSEAHAFAVPARGGATVLAGTR